MVSNGQPFESTSAGDRGSRLPGLLMIVGAIALPIIAWTHRPLEMRNFGEATQISMQGDWVLKPPFFYGAFALALVLLALGGLRIARPART